MFPATSWTLVLRATGPDASRSALEDLCAAYWRPLYAFSRRQVRDPEPLLSKIARPILAT
jgi:hypothetical protein